MVFIEDFLQGYDPPQEGWGNEGPQGLVDEDAMTSAGMGE